MSGPTNRHPYCECECGRWFQALKPTGDDWDADASMSAAYSHYVACPVVFEKAPQLIVEMAKTLRARELDLPKAERAS